MLLIKGTCDEEWNKKTHTPATTGRGKRQVKVEGTLALLP